MYGAVGVWTCYADVESGSPIGYWMHVVLLVVELFSLIVCRKIAKSNVG